MGGKIILILSIFASILLLSTTFSPVVAYQTVKNHASKTEVLIKPLITLIHKNLISSSNLTFKEILKYLLLALALPLLILVYLLLTFLILFAGITYAILDYIHTKDPSVLYNDLWQAFANAVYWPVEIIGFIVFIIIYIIIILSGFNPHPIENLQLSILKHFPIHTKNFKNLAVAGD